MVDVQPLQAGVLLKMPFYLNQSDFLAPLFSSASVPEHSVLFRLATCIQLPLPHTYFVSATGKYQKLLCYHEPQKKKQLKKKKKKLSNYCLYDKSGKVQLQVVIDTVSHSKSFLSHHRELSYYQKIKTSTVSSILCQPFLLTVITQLSKTTTKNHFLICIRTQVKVNVFCEC